MFNNLISKLAAIAATTVLGLGTLTMPSHALGKTLSGTFENGMTFSGNFEGEDKSGGGAIELDELTSFTMNVFFKEKIFSSIELKDLGFFSYSEQGVLNGDKPLHDFYFWDGFMFSGVNEANLIMMALGNFGAGQYTWETNDVKIQNWSQDSPFIDDYGFLRTRIKSSNISDLETTPKSNTNALKTVPEPASMLGLITFSAMGFYNFKHKKKQKA